LTLADKLRNICFVQGLYSDMIHTIIRSRKHSSFDDNRNGARRGQRNFFRKMKDTRVVMMLQMVQSAVIATSYVGRMCYLKDRKDTRVNQISIRNDNREKSSDMVCYNCQGRGHMARHCRKSKGHLDKPGLSKDRTGSSNRSGNKLRLSESSSRPTVHSTQ